MEHSALLDSLIVHLKRDKNKWLTATLLAKKINQPVHTVKEELLKQYLEYKQEALIIPSSLPSRITMEVLWGVRERVASKERPDIYLNGNALVNKGYENIIPEIFISHSHKDTTLLRKFKSFLLEQNYRCWLSENELSDGVIIADKIRGAITKSRIFCAFFTKNLLYSDWCAKEVFYAFDNLPHESTQVIPYSNVFFVFDQEAVELTNSFYRGESTTENYNLKELLSLLYDVIDKVNVFYWGDVEEVLCDKIITPMNQFSEFISHI